IVEESYVTGARTDDVTRELRGQALGHAPQRHAVARPTTSQVRRIVAMHRQPRAGRLAERERGARMIDVVVREDHPVDLTQVLFLEKAKHRLKAARVARIDDGQSLVAAVRE